MILFIFFFFYLFDIGAFFFFPWMIFIHWLRVSPIQHQGWFFLFFLISKFLARLCSDYLFQYQILLSSYVSPPYVSAEKKSLSFQA